VRAFGGSSDRARRSPGPLAVAEPEPDKLSRTALHPGSLHALSRGSWHVGTLARVAQPKRVRLQVERLFDRHEAPARGCASRAVRRLVGHATLGSRVLNQDMCCSRVLNARSTCVASRIVDRRSVPTQPLWTSARPSQAAVLSSCRTAWLSPSGGTTTVGELGEASGASVCCCDLLVAGGSTRSGCRRGFASTHGRRRGFLAEAGRGSTLIRRSLSSIL
jgi:hypothetical protein